MLAKVDVPHLEFGFYFTDRSDGDSIMVLIDSLIDRGANFTGDVLMVKGSGIRNAPFSSVSSIDDRENKVEKGSLQFTDLVKYLTDEDTKVLEVGLDSAIGLSNLEVVTFSPISKSAAQYDHHPLQLITGGESFDHIAFPSQSRRDGLTVYRSFIDIVKITNPGYASITVEYSLECPSDLRVDPRSYAFRDFYIGGDFASDSQLQRIRDIVKGSYIENVGSGLYISSRSWFNPKRINTSNERSIDQSVKVASVIAASGNRKYGSR